MINNTVLFLDDSPEIRTVTCAAIKRFGYNVICADNAETAMQEFVAQKPFMCILDLQLEEDIDGAILADRMHRLNPTCIFIAFTGDIGAFSLGMLLGSVFTDVLVKPVPFDLLRKVLDYGYEKANRWREFM